MITRRQILNGAMAGLMALTGCSMPEREPDTNPNPMYGYVNLDTHKMGYTPGIIVDEDRDGLPDYVVPDNMYTGPSYALFVREGFDKSKHPKFIVDSRTEVMNRSMLSRLKTIMDAQRGFNECVQNHNSNQ